MSNDGLNALLLDIYFNLEGDVYKGIGSSSSIQNSLLFTI